MAVPQYRIWITVGPEKETYLQLEDMAELARWFCEKEKPLGCWGIERYGIDNTWVDAFCCEDLIQLMWKMCDILLKI